MALTDEDKQWLSEQLERHQAHFSEKLTSIEARFNERLETVETRLLTEFHKWASPVEMRQRTHSAALRAVDIEMEALADRVTKLENRGEKPA